MDTPAEKAASVPDELDAIAKQLSRLHRNEIRAWLERGRLLARARSLLTGSFERWLREHRQTKRTAYRAIAAWQDFDGVATSPRFSKEAMHILHQSAPARFEAIELSKRGPVTARLARQLVNKHLGKQPKATAGPTKSTRVQQVYECPRGIVSVTLDIDAPTADDYKQALAYVFKQLTSRLAA